MAKLRIGISGWRYPPWRGRFYPADLPQRAELEFAARHFASIELNGTFYSLQRPEYFARWRDQTPADFVFSVKAPRFITHIKRLREIGSTLPNFLASGLLELRGKLGPVLWQLPPSLRYDKDLIGDFLRSLPRDTEQARRLARRHDERVKGRASLTIDRNRRLRHALEVRHPSFCDPGFVALARRHGVAIVVTDSAGHWPEIQDVSAGFMYLRLHGEGELYAGGYTEDALDDWARRIRAWSGGGEPGDAKRVSPRPPPARKTRDVYCYFDNDAKVKAPGDAQSLMRRLDLHWGRD
ncbi:MAG TPA: DUF72 domain-containing protein [Rhodanobacteraceae bacterium]|nr:DUF72 domain-containing protein [Rhodanobacteraceae bacterium]